MKASVMQFGRVWAPGGGNNMEQRFGFLKLKVFGVSLLALAAVSYADYVTGYDFLFFVFYFIPVGLCALVFERTATMGMAALSAGSWFAVDRVGGHLYPYEWFRYWNTFICFLAFAIIGLAIRHLQESREQELKARRELEKSLAELQASTEAIRNLQEQLQVVCAWTQRIRIEGKWIALDQFLTKKLNVKVTHGISPEAMKALEKQMNESAP